MQEQSKMRASTLRAICKEKDWNPTELSRQTGYGKPSYWNELLSDKRAFGEKAARKVEASLGLPPHALDETAYLPDELKALSKKARQIGELFDNFPDGKKKEFVFEMISTVLKAG
jgi:hypothetical protein